MENPIRVWCDGCFDGVHFGHANSLRQARALGDHLVVGVHNDDDICKFKGPTLFTEDERYTMIRAIKWVDQVVEGSTYWPNVDTLREHDCAFASHGDDLSVSTDGRDPYARLKEANVLKVYKRTPGTSTTDIVDRILNERLTRKVPPNITQLVYMCQLFAQPCAQHEAVAVFQYDDNGLVQPLCNAELLHQWHNAQHKIAYISGSWDLFHPGHLSQLSAAREYCDRLLVGVTQNNVEGNACVLNVYERALSVLACRYVNAVIINVPECVPSSVFDKLMVNSVCTLGWQTITDSDRPQHVMKPVCPTTTKAIITRVVSNRARFEKRNESKRAREAHDPPIS